MRILLLAVVLLAAVAPGAAAQLPAGLGPEGRVFTLMGDGNASPADGVPAHRVAESLLDLGRFAPLPGGEVAFAGGENARAFKVGADGRVHLIPPLRDISAMAAAPDGTLYAVERDEVVHRLPPGGPRWERVFDPVLQIPRWRQFDDEVESIAALPGGGFVFTADRGAFRVGDDGTHAEIALPRGSEPEYVAATAGGDAVVVVIDDNDRERVVTVPAGGSPVTLGLRGIFFGIATAPGGVLLRSAGTLDAFGLDGARLVRVGSDAPIGLGDGGSAAAARLVALGTLAERDGAVFTDDLASGGLEHVTEEQGGVEVPLPFLGSGFGTRVRVFAPPGTPMPLAAVARGTYETLDEGAVAVESTFAGRATVVVRREGVEVARATADVPAGASAVALGSPPPRGDLRVRLEVLAADGRVAGGTLAVATARRLARIDAIALADEINALIGEGGFEPVAGCRRTGALSIRCDYRERHRGRARCVARFLVVQRPDGRHATITGGRRACRTE